MQIKVGDILYADLSPVRGNEIGGLRKVLVKEVYDDVVVVIPCVYNYRNQSYEPHPYQIRAIDRCRFKEVSK
jgi:mRNA-degrading endonuclease toxin of MazEF toxin-antitoxin module